MDFFGVIKKKNCFLATYIFNFKEWGLKRNVLKLTSYFIPKDLKKVLKNFMMLKMRKIEKVRMERNICPNFKKILGLWNFWVILFCKFFANIEKIERLFRCKTYWCNGTLTTIWLADHLLSQYGQYCTKLSLLWEVELNIQLLMSVRQLNILTSYHLF